MRRASNRWGAAAASLVALSLNCALMEQLPHMLVRIPILAGTVGVFGLFAQSTPAVPANPSAEVDLGNSYRYYQLGRFADSI